MLRKVLSPLLLLTIFFGLKIPVSGQQDLTRLVNPFIGTGGHGHTYPGASMPFGMMQLSPDTRMADWDGSSGYHYSDSVIYGFSHTHLSGTGIPDYCDILFMPFFGKVHWDNKDYRSGFSHKNEKASPGYYEVLLDKDNILAQLTSSFRSGMHQYQYDRAAKDHSLLIDLQHRDEVLDSWIEFVSPTEIRGFRRSKSWAQDQHLYFYAKFEQPIASFQVNSGNDSTNSLKYNRGKNLKAALRFKKTGRERTLRVKVGISGVSVEGARRNLETEIPHWDFNQVRKTAITEWNKELTKIKISGGTRDQQVVFYTALYHASLSPNIYQDVDGKYRGTDLRVHEASGFNNYSVFSLWDTYRTLNPLMTIINPNKTNDWIKTFLAQYQQGGMLPVWELSGNETFCMIGYHSVPVIVDAYQKGIRDFDANLALKAMLSYAESDRYGLKHYRERGYIGNEADHESVSKTLEYAYDDWCIAQFAKMLGNDKVYQEYLHRSQHYKNLFDPRTGHMRGKIQSAWFSPFDPREVNNFFTEGNSWHYSFAVQQDIETLIQLHGGKEKFATKLDELFTTSSELTGRNQADVTGLIGQYAHGNEPSHHMAYLYNYAGMPWKTQELIHRINNEFYLNSPDGLIGNEDCGQMSAWFIMSAMGFYPVVPANGDYVIGSPLFDEVTVNLEGGKKIIIRKHGKNPAAKYVKGLKWNGKQISRSYLMHADLLQGGVLEFEMEEFPSKTWAVEDKDLPRSVVNENLIVSVPYFNLKDRNFSESKEVIIETLDGSEIYYRIENGEPQKKFLKYTGPFRIDSSCTVTSFTSKRGKESKRVSQYFHRIPGDKFIKVLTEVHPMYTGGGPAKLVDGLTGDAQWRSGEWHSYHKNDFTAIVDLKSEKSVKYLGIHVLQDVSPWIIFPKEVFFSTSNDGINYGNEIRVINQIQPSIDGAKTQELGTMVDLQARFIKVVAVNGGPLPNWHESAGQPSHLFIDEVIIR